MSSFTVAETHRLSIPEALARIRPLADRMANKYDLALTWRGDHAAGFRRSGLEGSLVIQATSVEVEIDLGFALRLFAGKIRRGIEAELAAARR